MHKLRAARAVASVLLLLFPLTACGVRYEPRHVPVPSTCEPLLEQATAEGVDSLNEAQLRQLAFCQQQQLLRAEEEQAAFSRYEARRRQIGDWFGIAYLVLTTAAFLAGGGR